MIAELAIANAAFAVIKETVSNGGDIFAAGQSLFNYFDNKSAIQRKVNEGGKSALEEFAALEQLKSQEDELKRMMIYHGRAGMWDDWLRFQAEAKKKRVEAEKAEMRKAAARKAKVVAAILWGLVASLGSVAIVMIWWIVDLVRHR
jgi:hypothetical protein